MLQHLFTWKLGPIRPPAIFITFEYRSVFFISAFSTSGVRVIHILKPLKENKIKIFLIAVSGLAIPPDQNLSQRESIFCLSVVELVSIGYSLPSLISYFFIFLLYVSIPPS